MNKLDLIIYEETNRLIEEEENIRVRAVAALADWVDGGYGARAGEKLLQYKQVLREILPPPKSPKWLFRGLEWLDKEPKPGQPVLYTSKRSSFSSWTSDLKVAHGFCAGGEGINPYEEKWLQNRMRRPIEGGIILAIDTAQLSQEQIVLWPYINMLNRIKKYLKSDRALNGLERYEHQQEWVLLIGDKPLVVAGLNFCGRDYGEFKPTRKITEDNKQEPLVLSDEGGELPE